MQHPQLPDSGSIQCKHSARISSHNESHSPSNRAQICRKLLLAPHPECQQNTSRAEHGLAGALRCACVLLLSSPPLSRCPQQAACPASTAPPASPWPAGNTAQHTARFGVFGATKLRTQHNTQPRGTMYVADQEPAAYSCKTASHRLQQLPAIVRAALPWCSPC
jgi:hypothetical protein